jgi:predicted nucleic acid-binding protein
VSYLVDTNVIAEIVRRLPDANVIAWFQVVPDSALHLSVLSLGELRKGVERLPAGTRRERLRVWLEQELPAWFDERLLPVTKDVADRWGRLAAEVGRSLPAVDGLLAATALHHGLRLVTRNVRDFKLPGLEVVNPWR